ncbi:MAG TPA: ABC transporter permease, partial [Acidobacteriaceae bacterium]
IRQGVAPNEAYRRARTELGSIAAQQASRREAAGLRLFDEVVGDLHYAIRRLRRAPGFTLTATISLALAIGVNTTIFSAAKQILYERIQAPDAGELRLFGWNGTGKRVAVHSIWGEMVQLPDGRKSSSSFSYPVYDQLRAQNREMQDIFAFKAMTGNATIAGAARRANGQLVSGNYFTQLRLQPALGRLIQESDDSPEANGSIAVISYGVWKREYGGSPAVLGAMVKFNEVPLTIIGVAPRGFTGAYSTMDSNDLYVPLKMQPLVRPNGDKGSMLTSNREWWLNLMARVRPEVPETKALAALDARLSAAARATLTVGPGEELPRMELRDGSRGVFLQSRGFAKPIEVLLTLAALVLLLACANIANLMLARSTRRRLEISVRFALGASRIRIMRQMLVESIMLALFGGAGGVLLGAFGSGFVPRLVVHGWQPGDFRVHLDWRVYAFTAALTLATGILFGVAPALAASRLDAGSSLKKTGRSFSAETGRTGKALVGFQIALSTLLVAGAFLFLRTLANLNSVDVGFRTDHLLLAEVNLPPKEYGEGKDYLFHQRLLEGISALPGVQAVTPASYAYINHWNAMTSFLPEGKAREEATDAAQYYNVVGDRFFSVMGIPILEGRAFNAEDTQDSARVGILNERMAKEQFPGVNPIGRYFHSDGKEAIRIVGICADTRYGDLRDEPPPQFFLPFSQQRRANQRWSGTWTYEIRASGDPEALTPGLRNVVRRLDADLPLINIRTQQQQIESTMQTERTLVALTTCFGLLALILAAVGIYGVMAYSVAGRTNEIGVRLALGALPRQVLVMVMREAAVLLVAGTCVGLGSSLLLARLIRSMLYGISPNDPKVLILTAGLLSAVAFAASWIPARRAASIEPTEALRYE